MNATFFRSTHDGVLAMWEFTVAEQDLWAVGLFREARRLQRQVVQRTVGLCGRIEIVGLLDEGDALPGWVLGDRGFLIPVDGPAGDDALRWLTGISGECQAPDLAAGTAKGPLLRLDERATLVISHTRGAPSMCG